MDEAVLNSNEGHALTLDAIEQIVWLSERDELADRRAQLGPEAEEVTPRVARLPRPWSHMMRRPP